MFSFICVWIHDWVNNREAGDLSRYSDHYDVIVMSPKISMWGHVQWVCPFIAEFVSVLPIPTKQQSINTLRRRRNEQHFTDAIFKPVFFNENVWVSIKISLKFVPKGPINNISALVQIMAWRRSGDKPLSEPMMVSLLTYICVTRSQWVNLSTGRLYDIC